MKRRIVLASCLLSATLGWPTGLSAGSAPPAAPGLTPWAQSMLCAPQADFSPAGEAGRVTASADGSPQAMFGPGERLAISRFSAGAIAPGQFYVAQRAPRSRVWDGHSEWTSAAIQRAGVVRVDEVVGAVATATVVWACDGVEAGDALVPLEVPQGPPAVGAQGAPALDASGAVLMGSQDRRLGAGRDMLLVARPEGQTPALGQRVTFFRRPFGDEGPAATLGRGVVQAVDDRTFTVSVQESRDAIYAGDLVALHR